jgi:hypothetical protein
MTANAAIADKTRLDLCHDAAIPVNPRKSRQVDETFVAAKVASEKVTPVAQSSDRTLPRLWLRLCNARLRRGNRFPEPIPRSGTSRNVCELAAPRHQESAGVAGEGAARSLSTGRDRDKNDDQKLVAGFRVQLTANGPIAPKKPQFSTL